MNKEKYNYNDEKNVLSYLDMVIDRTTPSLHQVFGYDWAFINNTAIYIIAKKYNLLNRIQPNLFNPNKLDIVVSDKYKSMDLSSFNNIINIFYMPSDKIIKLDEYKIYNVYNTILLEKMYCNSDISKNEIYNNLLNALEFVNKTLEEIVKIYDSLNSDNNLDELEFNDYQNNMKENILSISENINSELLE
jgi:hypothetical protein